MIWADAELTSTRATREPTASAQEVPPERLGCNSRDIRLSGEFLDRR